MGLEMLLAAASSMRSSKLVAKQFDINVDPGPVSDPLLEIRGRPPGMMGFVLSILGLGQSIHLLVTKDEARFESSNLAGRNVSVIPLAAVSSVESGYMKPIGLIIFGFMVSFFGVSGLLASQVGPPKRDLIPIFLGVAAVGVIMIFAYFFSKTFHVSINGEGSTTFRLLLKKSAVREAPLNERLTMDTLAVLRDAVIAARATVGGGSTMTQSQNYAGSSSSGYEPERDDYVEALAVEDDESVADRELQRAKKLYQDGHKDEAVKLLRKIASQYPDTEAAHTARKNLERV